MWSTKRLTDYARAICRNVCLFSAKVSNIASNAFTETSYRLVCTDKKKQTMGHLQLAVVSFWRHIFVIRPRVMRSMCHRLPRTHANSDQRVCLRIATVLIFSAVKTHSYSGYCDDILLLTFVGLQWNGLRVSTAKHSVARYRAATWLTADSSIDSDDITDARIFFSDNSDICGDDDERDVWCIWWNDKSHVLISTGVSKRKKKTDAFDDFGCTKQGNLLNVTIFKMLKRWRYIWNTSCL